MHFFFFFSSRRRHTRYWRDWSSDVCSSDLVVCVATESPVLDKMLSNIAEVRARGAHVMAIATEGNPQVAENAEEVVYVPRTDWLLQPILAIIPLQLLAYEIAKARGLNVDQPRNLAKRSEERRV